MKDAAEDLGFRFTCMSASLQVLDALTGLTPADLEVHVGSIFSIPAQRFPVHIVRCTV